MPRIPVKLLLLTAWIVGVGCSNTTTLPESELASKSSNAESESESVVVAKASKVEDASTVRQETSQQEPEGDAKPQVGANAQEYVVQKPIVSSPFPPVLLTVGHQKLCKVQVGDLFPKLILPRLGGAQTELASLFGKQATIVLFWTPDRWMARTALIDMQRDIANKFDATSVAVVGIAVRQPRGAVQATLNKAKTVFPQLMDSRGEAFSQVGTEVLPRIYVLDSTGKIVWFDIEYSEGTRRELGQTLSGLTKP